LGGLEHHRAEVGVELLGIGYNLTRLRVLGFARTLARRRTTEGHGNESDDDELARVLADSYFDHRDRDPALSPDAGPENRGQRPDHRRGCAGNELGARR